MIFRLEPFPVSETMSNRREWVVWIGWWTFSKRFLSMGWLWKSRDGEGAVVEHRGTVEIAAHTKAWLLVTA